MEELKKLIGQGLSFSDCVRAFAAGDGDPFVAAARKKANEQLEIDATAVASVGDDGAWVSAWVWVDNAEAGIAEEP